MRHVAWSLNSVERICRLNNARTADLRLTWVNDIWLGISLFLSVVDEWLLQWKSN